MSIRDAGQGPLVLLCHGFAETKYAWRHQISALEQAGYRAVAPDLRGYGSPDAPEHPDQNTVFHAVGDLDMLGEQQAVDVGHDWGDNCMASGPVTTRPVPCCRRTHRSDDGAAARATI
ncbi:alpha/beta fold hydrolase [Pseudorhizobium tarimense]|nr:alpha/beta hydrolase [Pseudorhizobium tarimense]